MVYLLKVDLCRPLFGRITTKPWVQKFKPLWFWNDYLGGVTWCRNFCWTKQTKQVFIQDKTHIRCFCFAPWSRYILVTLGTRRPKEGWSAIVSRGQPLKPSSITVYVHFMWLVGLGVWFSLRVREVPGSNPGRARSVYHEVEFCVQWLGKVSNSKSPIIWSTPFLCGLQWEALVTDIFFFFLQGQILAFKSRWKAISIKTSEV